MSSRPTARFKPHAPLPSATPQRAPVQAEAFFLLLLSLEDRREALAQYEAHRGAEETAKLKAEMVRQFNQKKRQKYV